MCPDMPFEPSGTTKLLLYLAGATLPGVDIIVNKTFTLFKHYGLILYEFIAGDGSNCNSNAFFIVL